MATKNFTVDARTILQLGRDSIKSHTTALAELIKNSYDADATHVEVEIITDIEEPYIRIADNGFGMTEKIIDDNWLRIGYSEKKEKKYSQKKRRKTGEKGIGRIAADRLGEILTLVTKAEEDSTQGIKINWELFNVEKEELSNIDIEVIENPILNSSNNSPTGTEIKVTRLRQEWTNDDIEQLYNELSTLISPFEKDDSFNIYLNTDLSPIYKGKKVESDFSDLAEVELELEYDGTGDNLEYRIYNRSINKDEIREEKISRLSNKIEGEKLSTGPFKLKLYFFLRNDSSILEESNFESMADFKDTLNKHVGIKIYRDNVAVKPYGFTASSSWDWLDLGKKRQKNPAGLNRSSYTISPRNLVGGVFIKRDKNPNLRDSAAREGLIESMAFTDLKKIIEFSVEVLAYHRHRIFTKKTLDEYNKYSEAEYKPSRVDKANQLSLKFNQIGSSLKDLSQKMDNDRVYYSRNRPEIIENLKKNAEETTEVGNEAVKIMEDLQDENRVLNGLATLGISSAVYGHETENNISSLVGASKNTNHLVKRFAKDIPDELEDSIEKIKEGSERILKYSKLVSAWGHFSLSRVLIDKRTNPKDFDVSKIINQAVKEIKPIFKASNIIINTELEKIIAKVYPIDIETILFNLISNSYKACLQKSNDRQIKILLRREDLDEQKGFEIQVIDSGPGIALSLIEKIWEPLFSKNSGNRNREGTGLGLTIVKAVVNDMEGKAIIYGTSELGGAKVSIWIPKNN